MFRENAANELAYNIGALIGDIFSIIEGLGKVISGITGAAAGAALAAQSGGASITVSGSGLALAANGMLITISGAGNAAKIMISEATSHGSGKNEGGSETNYGDQLEVSDQKMYQQGQHYNKHGKDMGYGSKKDYEAGARNFIENNKSTADIFEGKWNSSRGGQSGETRIIIRADGKQAIINKETGQIIDFYEGTSLNGFINVRQVQ